MIVVHVTKEGLSVCGHAGYDVPGKDVVCAGVTALTQTLIESIRDFSDDDPEYQLAPGFFQIEIKNLSERTSLLVDSFFIGLCSIAREFPEYVRIE